MKKYLLGIPLGLAALALCAALGLGFIHITEIPYSQCVDSLGIEASAGLAREDIMDNYRAVMSYLSPFSTGEFSLPSLAWSAHGAQHFYECRGIFRALYALGALGAALWAVAAIKLKKGRLPCGALAVSGAVTLLLPAALVAAVSADFEAAFVAFHRLFFTNDYWIFDARTDPVITILPEGFFLSCALVISAFLLLGAAAQFIVYARMRRAAV